jgi:hypothetical protein
MRQDESLRTLIIETYQATVRTALVPQELKESLKTYERVPAFLSNLHKELVRTPTATKDDVIGITESMTLTFLNLVDQKAKEAMMSDAEKNRILSDAQDAAQFSKGADELIETETISEETIDVLNKE